MPIRLSRLICCVFALAVAAPPSWAQSVPTDEVVPTAHRHARAGKFDGLWCGVGFLRGATLELKQQRANFDGVLKYRDRSRNVNGSIEGSTLRTFTEKAGELVLELQDGRLRIESAGGNLALAQGQSFVKAAADGCA